jgi:hypothetical protein
MRRADMITIVVHDRDTDAPLAVEPELIAHILGKTPQIASGTVLGKRSLIFAMSREEWEREFPVHSPAIA